MLNSIITTPVTFQGLIVCFIASIAFGILTALVFGFRAQISKSFTLTLAILPIAMAMIIMLINGNLGIAVGVAGSFTLVRFRSIAGTGREISAIFVEMALGVACGMGYIGVAFIFFIIVTILVIMLTLLNFGGSSYDKVIKITIPEDFDYTYLFDDIFKKYSVKAQVEKVKTINLGSLIEVSYRVSMPSAVVPKAMLDEIRTRNANLSVIIANLDIERETL